MPEELEIPVQEEAPVSVVYRRLQVLIPVNNVVKLGIQYFVRIGENYGKRCR